jgi:hypothetical protein
MVVVGQPPHRQHRPLLQDSRRLFFMLFAVLHKGTKKGRVKPAGRAMQWQIKTRNCESDDPISHPNFLYKSFG